MKENFQDSMAKGLLEHTEYWGYWIRHGRRHVAENRADRGIISSSLSGISDWSRRGALLGRRWGREMKSKNTKKSDAFQALIWNSGTNCCRSSSCFGFEDEAHNWSTAIRDISDIRSSFSWVFCLGTCYTSRYSNTTIKHIQEANIAHSYKLITSKRPLSTFCKRVVYLRSCILPNGAFPRLNYGPANASRTLRVRY